MASAGEQSVYRGHSSRARSHSPATFLRMKHELSGTEQKLKIRRRPSVFEGTSADFVSGERDLAVRLDGQRHRNLPARARST
eukprot:258173-Rhodomonas_salina.1